LRLISGTITALLLLAGGCTQARTVEVITLMSHGHCQELAPGVHRVDLDTVARLRGSTMIGFEDDPSGSEEEELLLIAIALGQRPSAGYGLVLDGPGQLHERALTLRVAETRPSPDAMAAQVITHPCLVVGIPDRDLDVVRVRDEGGALIGEVHL
jgi:hypothetical protein